MDAASRTTTLQARSLSIDQDLLDAVWIVRARGEIDFASAPALGEALRSAFHQGEGTIVLDLCDATFIDSAGLAALLDIHRRLTRERRRFAIACPEVILRALKTTHVAEVLEIHSSLEAALGAEPGIAS